jgi:DNA end-binding protein Ku
MARRLRKSSSDKGPSSDPKDASRRSARAVPSRGFASALITFGLVTLPVRLRSATRHGAGLSFHFLHAKDNARVREQYVCTADGAVVPRSELVRGYEFSKDQYVTLTDGELRTLDEKATQGIEIAEFVPLEAVDPLFFEKTYYLVPDKGAERPYALFAQALAAQKLAAIGQHATRGRDHLVLLRSVERRLVLHQLFHSDEIVPISQIEAPVPKSTPAELALAQRLLASSRRSRFDPAHYEDHVREAIASKVAGQPATPVAPARDSSKVIDLMKALKESLRRRGKSVSVEAESGRRRAPRRRAV